MGAISIISAFASACTDMQETTASTGCARTHNSVPVALSALSYAEVGPTCFCPGLNFNAVLPGCRTVVASGNTCASCVYGLFAMNAQQTGKVVQAVGRAKVVLT